MSLLLALLVAFNGGWGFTKSKDGQLPEVGKYKVVEQYGAIYHGNTARRQLYLTFDNGYENGYTEQILEVLQKKRVKATFFITGHYLRSAPKLVKRMIADGHIVANHSWSHPDLATASAPRIAAELQQLEQRYQQVTGHVMAKYMRPPRGTFSRQLLLEAQRLGYKTIFWSIAYRDWQTDQQRGRQVAYEQLMEQLHNGAIVLLHSVSADNAEVLAQFIDGARAKQYEFKSLTEM